MAIVEKRQLFRLNAEIIVNSRRLNDEDVNEAIQQLSQTHHRKNLFPKINPDDKPIKTNITIFGLSYFAKTSLLENSHLSIAIKLDTVPHPLLAVGQVAYCKYLPEESCYRVGVRFKFMSKPDMQALENYLVLKLQEGMAEQMPERRLVEKENWLFNQDSKKN